MSLDKVNVIYVTEKHKNGKKTTQLFYPALMIVYRF